MEGCWERRQGTRERSGIPRVGILRRKGKDGLIPMLPLPNGGKEESREGTGERERK